MVERQVPRLVRVALRVVRAVMLAIAAAAVTTVATTARAMGAIPRDTPEVVTGTTAITPTGMGKVTERVAAPTAADTVVAMAAVMVAETTSK